MSICVVWYTRQMNNFTCTHSWMCNFFLLYSLLLLFFFKLVCIVVVFQVVRLYRALSNWQNTLYTRFLFYIKYIVFFFKYYFSVSNIFINLIILFLLKSKYIERNKKKTTTTKRRKLLINLTPNRTQNLSSHILYQSVITFNLTT